MNDKKPKCFEIKASKLQGSGNFDCPECGTAISPDDKGGKNYKIIGTRTYRDVLTSMTIECGGCQSQIRLIGLSAQPKISPQYYAF